MPTIDTVVIGAGQAGLAASHCLAERGVDHVVLERGRLAERWRSERWDSLRLLTPNWMSRLPGFRYTGPDPHGYMTAAEVVEHFARYARATAAPVQEETEVECLEPGDGGFVVSTTNSRWRATNVVIATGWCDRPAVPALAPLLDPRILQVTPPSYRNPWMLPDGGVLVVGASATGVQIADELATSGRDVVLAVGGHSRMPRRYRGMDIFWWLDRTGTFDRTIDELPDPVVARAEPSVQVVGRPDHRTLDLATLQAAGVHLTGRLTGTDGRHVQFDDGLSRSVATADARLRRVLADIDLHIEANGLAGEVLPPDADPVPVTDRGTRTLDLGARGITTVIWATGYRRAYPWLHAPVFGADGEIRQYRGVTPVPGLYVLGQRFQHFRNSNFIDGVGRDAAFVADHLVHRCAPGAPLLIGTRP